VSFKERKKKRAFKKIIVKNWLWVAIGVYLITTLIGWIGYVMGIIPLLGIVLTTIGIPIFLFGIFYIRKLDNRTINKYVWIITGAAVFGGIIWFGIAYIFQGAPWAPLRNSELIYRIIFSVGSALACWGLGGFIGYKIGKRRDFKPFSQVS
jgi:hypothetical protein